MASNGRVAAFNFQMRMAMACLLQLLTLLDFLAVLDQIVEVFQVTWHVAVGGAVRRRFGVWNAQSQRICALYVVVLRWMVILRLRTVAYETKLRAADLTRIVVRQNFPFQCRQQARALVNPRRWALARERIARIQPDLDDVRLVVLVLLIIAWQCAGPDKRVHRTLRLISHQTTRNLVVIVALVAAADTWMLNTVHHWHVLV